MYSVCQIANYWPDLYSDKKTTKSCCLLFLFEGNTKEAMAYIIVGFMLLSPGSEPRRKVASQAYIYMLWGVT